MPKIKHMCNKINSRYIHLPIEPDFLVSDSSQMSLSRFISDALDKYSRFKLVHIYRHFLPNKYVLKNLNLKLTPTSQVNEVVKLVNIGIQ